jgi:pimeloyl-ACP methyl ester carboxylesterase
MVLADGWRVHVMEWGPPDGRPVLLVHGNPTWGFLWRKVVAALAGTPLRLVVPDLVGLGYSDKPGDAGAHTLDHHTRIFGAVVDALALQDVLLVVQDWGGPIGVGAFVTRKPRLTGLVVCNTVLSPPRPGFKPALFHRFANTPIVSDLAFRLLDMPQRVLHTAQGDRQSIRGDVARAYLEPLRGLRNNVAPLALARMVPNSEQHPSNTALRACQELVTSFVGPCAMVWGDRDPVLGRVRSWMEKLLPKAPVTRTNAGHFLQEEVPQEIAAAICSVAGVALPAVHT